MEASRITCPRSFKSASSWPSEPSGRRARSRASSSSCRTVPTRHGTHWPHDSSRKNSAMRRTMSRRSTDAPKTMTTPEPSSSRSEEHTSELQSRQYLVCRLLLEKKKTTSEQMLEMVKEAAKNTPTDKWLFGEGWNENNFADQLIPSIGELDAIRNEQNLLPRICH